jgi:hypothetical protein
MSQTVLDVQEITIPVDYVCSDCGATDCKLWRHCDYEKNQLLCVDCASRNQSIQVFDIDDQGERDHKYGVPTDKIGIFLPAVPDGTGCFFDYYQTPQVCFDWWRSLPTHP